MVLYGNNQFRYLLNSLHTSLQQIRYHIYYFLETNENIPLITPEKKSLNIVLILLSLPLQGCKS